MSDAAKCTRWHISDSDVDGWIGTVFLALLLVAVVAGVTFLAVALIKSARSDGRADFCRIESAPPVYRLWAHRPWRADEFVTLTPTLPEAVSAAAAVGCPVNARSAP